MKQSIFTPKYPPFVCGMQQSGRQARRYKEADAISSSHTADREILRMREDLGLAEYRTITPVTVFG